MDTFKIAKEYIYSQNPLIDEYNQKIEELSDTIYLNVYGEYLLLLDMLPSEFTTKSEYVNVRYNRTMLYLSRPMYDTKYSTIELSDKDKQLCDELDNYKNKLTFLKIQCQYQIEELYSKIRRFRKAQNLIKAHPYLKEFVLCN